MAILLCPLLFALFARGVIAQFLNPPNSNATGGISGLQLVEGSTVVVSWNLPSDATQAQSKLYLWLNPGVTGFILTGNTTLDYFNWTVSAYGTNLSDVSHFHLTLYAEDKQATAGQGYFSTEVFQIVDGPISSSSSASPTASSTTSSSSPVVPTTPSKPQTSSSQTSAPAHTGLATSTEIGLGVGIGLGVAVLAVIGFIFGKRYQKSRTTKEKEGTAAGNDVRYTQYYEPGELPGPEHKHSQMPAEMPVNHSGLASELPAHSFRSTRSTSASGSGRVE